MTPHADLCGRIDRLKTTVPVFRIMAEATVTHPSYYNWHKQESELMIRWFKMVRAVGLDPLAIKPGESTYLAIKKRLLTRPEVIKHFQKFGYSDQTAEKWAVQGDPRNVENFKSVNEVVKKYEVELFQAEKV